MGPLKFLIVSIVGILTLAHCASAEISVEELLAQGQMASYPSKEKREGILISHIAKDSHWERVGLQNGDIVLRVNGKSLTDKNSYAALLSEVAKSASPTFEVLRKNPKTMKLEKRVIAPSSQ